jgi:hypothetical protein
MWNRELSIWQNQGRRPKLYATAMMRYCANIIFVHDGTGDVMCVWILGFRCFQLERDIQTLRERNAEVCHIFLLREDLIYDYMDYTVVRGTSK